MKAVIVSLFSVMILCAGIVNAQEEGPYFENTIVPRKGRLFAVDYDMKSKTFRVSLVGNTVKGLSSSRYAVSAATTDAKGLEQQLDLVSVADGYKFKDEVKLKKEIKIKVHDKQTKESELFLLKP
ncbi:hypothetical protein ACLVWU_07710 [Bdellovibrio sp. HCB290]|uniref:hypothetical protein n=1 Tax=Bdellovibrio sp. HCB290 TaxID=3394356 RepID=UPI0039B64CA4